MICPECTYWSWLPDPDTVQQFTFPLLVFGLVLALLEIRYHGLVARAERWVYESGPRLRNSAVYDSLSGLWHGQWTTGARNGALFLVIVIGVFQALYYIIMIDSVLAFVGTWITLALIGLLGMRFSESRDELVRVACLVVVMGTCIQIVAAYGLVLIASRTATRVLGYFDRSGGKAIGRIGITLGTFGLLGEAYQLLWIGRVQYWIVIALAPVLLGAAVFFISRMMRRAEVKVEHLHMEEEGRDALHP